MKQLELIGAGSLLQVRPHTLKKKNEAEMKQLQLIRASSLLLVRPHTLVAYGLTH